MYETSFNDSYWGRDILWYISKIEEQGQKVLKYLNICTLLFKLRWLTKDGQIFYNLFRLSDYMVSE